ncbi:MAG: TIGR03084 family metal-binding protein [Acidimicrobiales bacterium]
MTATLAPLLTDLAAEHAALEEIVAPLDDHAWDTSTPAAGWGVRDQIGHLTFFDRAASMALADPQGFAAEWEAALADLGTYVRASEARARALDPAALLEEWRDGRAALLAAAANVDPAARVPWYGPSMGTRSFLTARLMETWAHGLDIADGLGMTLPASERLRHVAHLGVSTRAWSYVARGLEPPADPVRVELSSPIDNAAEPWVWGDEGAANRVRGPALDFCLVVTQRRHVVDTALVAEGPLAQEWLPIAQAFAGPPTDTDGAQRLVGWLAT